ncbi:MAG: PHB depolymerase family esterase [Myxococcota bacterium]
MVSGRAGGGIVLGGDRPVELVVPAGYAGEALPLVLSLHGYGVAPEAHDATLGLSPRVDARRFFLLTPAGTPEAGAGPAFWNATDACCDFAASGVDDVAYLTGLVEEAAQHVNLDRARVYVVGLSNGAFMAHRLACDAGERFAGIAAIGGVAPLDPEACPAASPVSVLQVHGTEDAIVRYAGGDLRAVARSARVHAHPGAEESALRWALRGGCAATPRVGPRLDLDANVPGPETRPASFPGCAEGVSVVLWRLEGSRHVPAFGPALADQLLDVLFEGSR